MHLIGCPKEADPRNETCDCERLSKLRTPIMSIEEITALLRAQAELRSQENDEAGVLLRHADEIEAEVRDL